MGCGVGICEPVGRKPNASATYENEIASPFGENQPAEPCALN